MFAVENSVIDHTDDELLGGAAAEAVNDVFDGAHGDILAGFRGAIDEGAAADFVGDVAFFFQAAQDVRMVDSFMGRWAARASRQASEETGPWDQTWSMTSCSTSPRLRGRVVGVRAIVTLQVVTDGAKACQAEIFLGVEEPLLDAGWQRKMGATNIRSNSGRVETRPYENDEASAVAFRGALR